MRSDARCGQPRHSDPEMHRYQSVMRPEVKGDHPSPQCITVQNNAGHLCQPRQRILHERVFIRSYLRHTDVIQVIQRGSRADNALDIGRSRLKRHGTSA